MRDGYYLVRMSEDQLDEFAGLAENVSGARPSSEDTDRLFDTSAWGKEYIAFLARQRDTNETAAFYGIFPCAVEYNGERHVAAQSGSTMTHTRHRRQGLFYKAAKETCRLARDEGISFIFGFPNSSSHPGFIKMGWTEEGSVNAYHIIVPTLPLSYLAARFRFLQRAYRLWFRTIAALWRVSYRSFPNSSRGEGVGNVVHDESLLAYKPESDRRLMLRFSGTTVWVNLQGGKLGIGDIDLLTGTADSAKAIRGLKLFCFLAGIFHLRTYVSPESRLDKVFQRHGYRPRSGLPIIHFDLDSNLPLQAFKYVYADFDTF